MCLTRGMKVLLRVGQSEWGWGLPTGGRGSVSTGEMVRGSQLSPSLGSPPSTGPRVGAIPRKPVSEMPMEKDRGAAHSLEPGKESMPGRKGGCPVPSVLSDPAALPSPFPSLHFGGGDTGKREDRRVGREWKPNEEKTQLELISQVSASISAVREVGRTLWQGTAGWTPGF